MGTLNWDGCMNLQRKRTKDIKRVASSLKELWSLKWTGWKNSFHMISSIMNSRFEVLVTPGVAVNGCSCLSQMALYTATRFFLYTIDDYIHEHYYQLEHFLWFFL